MKPELILSIVVAVSTFVYTIINALMLRENYKTRMQKNTPHLIAYLKSSDDHKTLKLFIKNIGEGYAKNVSFNMIRDYNIFRREDGLSSAYSSIKNGVNSFPPNYEISCTIDFYDDEFISHIDDLGLIIGVTYYNNNDLKFSQQYNLPFNQIPTIYANPPSSYIGQIAYYLKAIDGKVGKLSN